ncbi:HD domain-containing protein [Balneatrix alpica]|uniref:HD domain-containing protein n=1 Tax=Balneatrix alpica TaxID=75684 RepID=UPI002738C9A2|nr:hypothetical protein [Balneatrix alpica]
MSFQIIYKLIREITFSHSAAQLLTKEIINQYNEPHRHYHTLEHILESLSALEQLKPPNKKHLQIAIIFHDIIYQYGSSKNEKNSSEFFDKQSANMVGIDKNLIKDLILVTKRNSEPKSELEKIILDIDLHSFSKNRRSTLRDTALCIKESNGDIESQIKFIKNLLTKNFIYHTDYYRKKHEKTARLNIQVVLMCLEKRHKNKIKE